MTYPPQPPNPYEPQPDPNQQQPPGQAPGSGPVPGYGEVPGPGQAPMYGQAPGAGPAPEYGQTPGYGPAPTYGQTPGYGPAPAYGPGPVYGQGPGYGPQPGYGYPQPRPRRTGLIITLVAVVVVGAIVTTVLLLSGSSNSPEGVAEQVATAFEHKDSQAGRATLCDPTRKSSGFDILDKAPANVTLKEVSTEVNKTSDSAATARLTFQITEDGKLQQRQPKLTLTLASQNGKWCVAKLSTSS